MKYTLQVNQIAAHGIGIQDKIDLIDLCLFDAFKSFANSAKCEKMIDDNGIWFWISYAEIIRELPLAKIKTKDGIYRRMLKLRDAGLIVFHKNNQKATKTFFQWGKNYDAMERTDWEEQPKDKKPKVVKDLRMKNRSTYGQETVAPTDEKPYNQTTINQTTKTKGERTPPAPNPSTSKEEKKENGLVAPGRADEWPTNCEFCEGNGMKDVGSGPANCLECGGSGVKAETPPSPNSAPPHSPADTCLNCGGSKANDYKTCVGCDGFDNPEYGPRFKVTAIAYPTDLPGVTLVEAAPKLQPLPRVATTLEAETKIMAWITGEGLETVKHRFSIAKQRFDPDNAAAIAAHYCSVYTKNAANK